jgi:hypothetical protein
VRAARDSHHSGELAAGEGAHRAQSRTHQDRLVKKLRRTGVADIGAANAFLQAAYWAEHNQRFAAPPASADDFHVAVPRGVRLEAVFRLEEERTVSNDWVVRYDNRYFQIERQSHRPPARSTVQVYEAADGQIEIRYRDHAMRWQELSADSIVAKQTASPQAWQAPAPKPVALPTPPRVRQRHRPSIDHPWRRGYDERVANRAPSGATP